MKKTKHFNISVPELGDVPDIIQVSNAISDLEDATAGTLEIMKAEMQGTKITLTSVSRKTKRTGYYEGMSIRFKSPQDIEPNYLKTVSVDDLSDQVLSVAYKVNRNEYIDIVYEEDKFTAYPVVVQKTDSVSSNSSILVGTAKGVKTAYDKGVEALNKANQKLNKGSYEGDADDLKREIDGKEPAFSKKTGFNLDKSDSVTSNSSSTLATSAAVKSAYDKGVNAERIANTKEPAFSKKTGFNLEKTSDYKSADDNKLFTQQGANSLYNELNSKIATNCPYNVGDIYITTRSENPSSIWLGTTWQKIEGRFLLGTSGSGASKQTGGSSSVTLGINNMPSHSHSASQSSHSHTQPAHVHEINTFVADSSGSGRVTDWSDGWRYKNPGSTHSAGGENTGSAQPSISVGNTGGGQAFSIMPPYFTVHVWVRTK